MEWFQLIGVCLMASVIVVILRQMNPSVAGLLCAAFGVMLLGVLLPEIQRYVEIIRQFLGDLGLEGDYYAVMLKAMGVVLITQIAEQICCDMGVQAIADRVELCGRLAMLGIAIPLFIDLTWMAVEVLR